VAFTNATSFINLVLSLALFIKGTVSPDEYLLEGLLSILYDHAPLVFTFKSILSCVHPSLDAGNIRLNLHVLVSDYAKLDSTKSQTKRNNHIPPNCGPIQNFFLQNPNISA
jgi:hypothetical protein